MARQGHGFTFEKDVIKRYGLMEAVQYTSRIDALTEEGIPVQIKLTKMCGEICLGSFQRNREIDTDFILYLGFWEGTNKNVVKEISLKISVEKWKQLLELENEKEMIEEFDGFSNNEEDDKRFKEFRKKIMNGWGGRLVMLRFKRDHKKQKRIQLAIPNRHIEEFTSLFEIFDMKEIEDNHSVASKADHFMASKADHLVASKADHSVASKADVEEARKLDKFYTKIDIAEDLVEKLNKIIPLRTFGGFLEPAAGSGSFLKPLQKFKKPILAIDILPEGDDIEEADFLKDDLDLPEGKVAVVSNPPFGSNASLAIKFFNQAAKYREVDLIAFILPCSFRKDSIQKRLSLYFHLIEDFEMSPQSFLLCGRPYEVPCCFMVWERRKIKRIIEKMPETNEFYEFVKAEEANIAIRRVGINAGFASILNLSKSPSKESHYFVKLSDKYECSDLIEEFNKLKWPKNNTTGPRSISKAEMIVKINELF